MKTLLLIAALPLLAQQRLSSPVTVGGVNCGEIQLRKQFPNSAQYMAWRNCENVGEMSMELINNANDLKARFGNNTSGTLTLFNASAQAGLQLSGGGIVQGFSSGIQRFNLNSGSGILDLRSASNVNIIRLDASNAGGVFTSAGSDVTLSQTGDSLGGMSLSLRNRFAENGMVLANPTLDLADLILRGSSGTQRSIRLENRSSTGFTLLEGSPEFQLGDMGSTGGIGFMANANGAGVGRGDYFRLLGSSSGYLGLRGPATGPNIDWTLPSGSGAAGQCWGYSSAGVLGWLTCSGSAPSNMVTTDTDQTISGNKYISTALDSNNIGIRSSAAGLARILLEGNSTSGAVASFYSGSGATTAQFIGQLPSSNTAGLLFLDPVGSAETIRIQGGSSSIFPSLAFFRGGSTGLTAGVTSSTGGYINVFTSSGTQVISMDGSVSGRIRVWDGSTLQTGFTGARTIGGCNINWAMGIVISVTGPLTCI
jgi:hypothetical protein